MNCLKLYLLVRINTQVSKWDFMKKKHNLGSENTWNETRVPDYLVNSKVDGELCED